MRNEQHQTEMQIENILREEPSPYKRKHQIDREKCILTVFNNRDNYTLVEYLRGIAHNISKIDFFREINVTGSNIYDVIF